MKKLYKTLAICVILVLAMLTFAACESVSDSRSNKSESVGSFAPEAETGDIFIPIIENKVTSTLDNAISTFSLAVNTAGYTNLRSYVNNGYTINPDMVKIEEIVNYFQYDYPDPANGYPVSLSAILAPCPWNPESKLVTIGVKAAEIPEQQVEDTADNLVFLIDVSGSMASSNKIDLIKASLPMLVAQLNENDRISIVTYSNTAQTLLSGVDGSQKTRINNVIASLKASGSTAGAQGIQTAYSLAQDYYIQGGNNRVILATDGDFNVGISTTEALKTYIAGKRDTGIYLTALGVGSGNLHDTTMETLANNGNGNYYYLDSIQEAQRVFVEGMNSTLRTLARDAKVKVEFNPALVSSYRLIGYDNYLLTLDQWEDYNTDAGEIGYGLTVTAVYEVVLADNPEVESTMGDNLFNIQLRYKSPDLTDETQYTVERNANASNITETPNEDIQFIGALVQACLVLRRSEYKGTSTLTDALERLNALDSVVSDANRAEFKIILQKLISDYNY